MPSLVALAVAGSGCRLHRPSHNLVRPMLPPSANEPIKQVFDRMSPALRYDSISIDHDHVVASVCPNAPTTPPCFAVRLEAPQDDCFGQRTGVFCLSFPGAAPPPQVRDAVESALRTVEKPLWISAASTDSHRADENARPPPPGVLARVWTTLNTNTHLLMALLGVIGCVMAMAAPRNGTSPSRIFSLLELAGAAAIGVGTYLWMRHASPPKWDTCRRFSIEDLCLRDGQCFTVEGGSSALLTNGAVWHELTLGLRYLGGACTAYYGSILLVTAVGVAVLFLFTSRFVRPALAAPAAGFALAFLGHQSYSEPILDCSITFFLATCAAVALTIFVCRGRSSALAVAGIFVAHSVECHVSTLALLPAYFALAALAGRDRVKSIALAIIVFFTTCIITSAQTLQSNWDVIMSNNLYPFVFAAAAVVFIGGYRLNPWFRRLSQPLRAGAVAICLIVPHVLGCLVLLHIGHPVLERYHPVIVGAVSVVMAWSLAWLAQQPFPLRLGYWMGVALPLAASLIDLNMDAARVDPINLTPDTGGWACADPSPSSSRGRG